MLIFKLVNRNKEEKEEMIAVSPEKIIMVEEGDNENECRLWMGGEAVIHVVSSFMNTVNLIRDAKKRR